MQKLDGMDITIELRVIKTLMKQYRPLHGLLFQMLQKNVKSQKKLEASYIALWKRNPNEQKYFEGLVLFSNGVTHFEASYITLPKPDLNKQKEFQRLVLVRNGVT